MFVSFYEIAILGAFSPLLRNLAFATLFMMFLYVFLGKAFQSMGGWGQLLFIGIGVLFAIFTDQIAGVFNLRFELVPLSFSPFAISLTVNGQDITWGLGVGLIATVYFTRHDWLSWLGR